jgi:hypothetical protein|tara:strand:+ start:786 stop:2345 length:1560 start_codon:yes stop_codon:yes gene_type:complete
MEKAKARYDYLRSFRDQYLQTALEAARLTIPYLIRQDDEDGTKSRSQLKTPWQAVGARGVSTLASKLMLALMPPQTSFFKLQLDEAKLLEQEIDASVRSDIDLSFSKIERTINEMISASDDRVIVHQAMKHLVVSGNALIFMDKDQLKIYPLNRYVVDRDGSGNVIEIVTRERVHRSLVEPRLPKEAARQMNPVGDDGESASRHEDVDVYTHVKRDNNRFVWYQESMDYVLEKSFGKAPLETNPWICLRFNTVDQEPYGRGRVEEYMGDLKSLEALSQAIVEGSAAAAKVVFVVSPSSTTKPQTLAQAGNGAIVQGRPDDIGVVQVGKTADFQTAQAMMQGLEKRLGDAFLILQVRNSERTTAEEVRLTQLELEQSLGGLFSLLTVEFLVPYLNRKMSALQKSNEIPRLPKDLVKPTIVAGINAIGRGQDSDALTQFMTTIAQTVGPEAIAQYINSDELIKRYAAAQGIDYLNLVKTKQELAAEQNAQQNNAMDMEMAKQASSFAAVDQQAQANAAQQI